MTGIFIIVIGLVIGSFLNVVIYRLPNKLSIVYPERSFCPSCKHKLGILDLVPVFSWLFLRGRCRYCGEKISFKYPLVEVITAVTIYLIYIKYGLTVQALSYMILMLVLISEAFIDIDYMEINVNILIVGALLIGLLDIAGILFNVITIKDFLNQVYGMLLAFTILLILVLPGWTGGGDLKVAILVGFTIGFQPTIMFLYTSYFIGGIVSIIMLAFRTKLLKSAIPFVPYLALGALVSILAWKDLIHYVLG